LVHVDVGALGADHRAPAVGDRLEGDHVGAGAVEDRERLGCGAEVAAHDLLEVLGGGVLAVRHLVPAVGQGHGGEHLPVGTGVVVAGEAADVRVVMTTRVGPRRVHGFSVSHRRFPFTSAAGFSQTPTMASARSLTSVKPANFALGRSARIASCTNAFTTRIAAAAVGPCSPPALRRWSAMASVQASAAALPAA